MIYEWAAFYGDGCLSEVSFIISDNLNAALPFGVYQMEQSIINMCVKYHSKYMYVCI